VDVPLSQQRGTASLFGGVWTVEDLNRFLVVQAEELGNVLNFIEGPRELSEM
jgi:hypothetical protein